MKKLSAFILALLILTLGGCSKADNASSDVDINSSENVSSVEESSLIETSSDEASSSEIISSDESSTTTTPNKTTVSQPAKTTSSNTKKVNDSTNIVFKDEGSLIISPDFGAVPVREAYEKGYIQIKIIDGLAYPILMVNGVGYIQEANTDTGISYDGESPIIYTYPDGTTGTEKLDGAKYEKLPGIYVTVHLPKDDSGRLVGSVCEICNKKVGHKYYPDGCEQFSLSRYCSYCGEFTEAYTCHHCTSDEYTFCSHCGKVAGLGENGTCLRSLWSDMNCVSCGDLIPANTCHTCSKGCKYCGRTMGNGINNTCYRDYFNPTSCPSCKTEVPTNTCHTCN